MIASLPEEPEEWMITFAEAWQAATEKLMPSIVHKRASVWAGAEVPPPPKIKDAGKSFPVLGGGASGASAPAATSVGDEGLAELKVSSAGHEGGELSSESDRRLEAVTHVRA